MLNPLNVEPSHELLSPYHELITRYHDLFFLFLHVPSRAQQECVGERVLKIS